LRFAWGAGGGLTGDRNRLYAAAFLRSLATGLSGVLLGLYLADVGLNATQIGYAISAGLGGGALAALITTIAGDRIGRRRILIAVNLLGAAGGLVLAFTGSPWLLIAASFAGMINGMGRDRGATLILDQAILPSTTTDKDRTRTFAIYNVCQDIGHAIGGLLAIIPDMKLCMILYAVLLAMAAILGTTLSPAVESTTPKARPTLSPRSRGLITKISALFAMDSLGGGFLTTSLLAYFFHERFQVPTATIGILFFTARIANAGSHLGAAWLARRIGLVNTMVFTHLPSSLLLLTVPFAPNFTVAAILFLLRESLVEMDVPTRQSYVIAVVSKEERTVASGITHLVRLGAWAVAPAFAGTMMTGALGAPLIAGAGLKIAYDLLLWRAFRGVKAPEEG